MNPVLLLGLVAGSAIAPQPTTVPGEVIDKGVFRVYQRNRALGTETFEFDSRGDSLTIFSQVSQVLPGPDGDVPVEKQVVLIVGALDYDLRFYQSVLKMGNKDLTRGLVISDTAFTAYRESSTQGGMGDRFERPPGRVFVLDAQVFVLFDVMCRDLGRTAFTSRPVWVILLRDEQDQVTRVTVTDLGNETIRWGERPVSTRKLRLADSYSTFNAWVGPRGFMLRLEQPGSGLRVEREPTLVKRATAPSPR